RILDYQPPLTLAETASTFGQTLALHHILSAEPDGPIRCAILCKQIDGLTESIFRQVAFTRFEEATHTLHRREGELSVDQIGDCWQERLQAMFGDSLVLTDDHRAWWSYVEHFVSTPGYVYSYAFGNLLALALYRRWQEAGEPFAHAYLGLLAAG